MNKTKKIQIPGPTGVPFTLQVFAVGLCGYVLGWKLGALAVVIYVLLGTVGVPVFAGATAGPGVLVGVSGGFIFGFIVQAACCGLFVNRKVANKGLRILLLAVSGAAGAAICEILGAVTIHLVGGMGYGLPAGSAEDISCAVYFPAHPEGTSCIGSYGVSVWPAGNRPGFQIARSRRRRRHHFIWG